MIDSLMTLLQHPISSMTQFAHTVRNLLSSAPLLQCAAILAAGLLLGEAARRWLRVPTVVGYMAAGILLGPSVLALIGQGSPTLATTSLASAANSIVVTATGPTTFVSQIFDVCLGFVLFELGRKLDLSWLRLNPWILVLGLAEMSITALAVFAFLHIGGVGWMAAALVSAVVIASSPAVIMAVVREGAAEGQVTKRALCLVALNCLVAFIATHTLLAFASPQPHLGGALFDATKQVAGALALGAGIAMLMCWAAALVGKTPERQLVLLTAGLCATAGLTHALDVSLLISMLAIGIYARNFDRGAHLMAVKMGFSGQLMLLLLFVYAGANMQFEALAHLFAAQGTDAPFSGLSVVLISIGLLATRALAKLIAVAMFGAWGGLDFRRVIWLAMSLLPMGEVSLLMTAAVGATAGGFAAVFAHSIGVHLLSALLLAIALSQLAGPILVQLALRRAGETRPLERVHNPDGALRSRAALRDAITAA
jgi:Kef-type K+ transport system membrane component KefB